MARWRFARVFLNTAQAVVVSPFLLLNGCGESALQPPDAPISGRWILVSVAGDALPALTLASDSTSRVAADTVTFRSDGSGERVSFYRAGALNAQRQDRRGRSTFRWTQTGDVVEVFLTCPPDAACIAGPHLVGYVDGDTVDVLQPGTVLRAPWRYLRR